MKQFVGFMIVILLLTGGIVAQGIESGSSSSGSSSQTLKEKFGFGKKNYVNVYINPEKQEENQGEWVRYEVAVKDSHPIAKPCKSGEACIAGFKTYEYNLMLSGNNLQYYFVQKDIAENSDVGFEVMKNVDYTKSIDNSAKIYLVAGEKKTLELYVMSENIGENNFVVSANGNDGKAKVKGTLVVIPSQKTVFEGKGYLMSTSDEEGFPFYITLESNGKNVNGKMYDDTQSYQVEGWINGENLNFQILNDGETAAKFTGVIKDYENFEVIKGTIESDEEIYEFIAFSEQTLVYPVMEYEINGKVLTTETNVFSG